MNIIGEIAIIGRYSVVGLAATSTHVIIVWMLIGNLKLAPFLSNFLAFLIAFVVSFLGNYIWAFNSKNKAARVLVRMLVVSLLGFGLNNVTMLVLLQLKSLAPVLSAILAALMVPVFTFVLSRLWVFRD